MGTRFEFRSLIRPRLKVCRHCGAIFTTVSAARKTCERPECEAWTKDRRKKQVADAVLRFRRKKRILKEVH